MASGRPAIAEVHQDAAGGSASAQVAPEAGSGPNASRPSEPWPDHLDNHHQRARQSAARRYE
jgi:hypothetical protein